MKEIISDIVYIKKTTELAEIESQLSENFGSVIRWAIISVEEESLKISVTYQKGSPD